MRRLVFIVFLFVGIIAACSDPEITPQKNENSVLENENTSEIKMTDLSALEPENINVNKNSNSTIEETGTVVLNRMSSARFEIVSLEGNYQDKNPLFKRNVAQEYQLVRVGVRITGISEQAFPFDSLNFSLDTPIAKTILESELGSANEVQDHIVQQVQLANGKTVQGALYFEVDKKTATGDMVLSYESLTPQKESLEYKIRP
ncbi:MAG: DUF4352 domain-containing protein [Candidatus Gracilibacteria bacterium]